MILPYLVVSPSLLTTSNIKIKYLDKDKVSKFDAIF